MQEIVITLKIEKQNALNLEILSGAILSLNKSIGNFIEIDKGFGGDRTNKKRAKRARI